MSVRELTEAELQVMGQAALGGRDLFCRSVVAVRLLACACGLIHLLILSACSGPQEQQQQISVDEFVESLPDTIHPATVVVSSDERGWWRSGVEGEALSSGGEYAAISVRGAPVNEIHVAHLLSETGWRLVHRDPRALLGDPAFAADGRRMAIVITRPPFFGAAEIWVGDFRTGEGAIVRAAERRSYRHPIFTRDGERLVYCQSTDPWPSMSESSLTERPNQFWSIFEYDINTGVERRLTEFDYRSCLDLVMDPVSGTMLSLARVSTEVSADHARPTERRVERSDMAAWDTEPNIVPVETSARRMWIQDVLRRERETMARPRGDDEQYPLRFVGFLSTGAMVANRMERAPDGGPGTLNSFVVIHDTSGELAQLRLPSPFHRSVLVSPWAEAIALVQDRTAESMRTELYFTRPIIYTFSYSGQLLRTISLENIEFEQVVEFQYNESITVPHGENP